MLHRSKYGIRRSLDGRAQLRRKNGTWMSIRLDMEVPGAILLRDTKTSQVYALETDSLPQVGTEALLNVHGLGGSCQHMQCDLSCYGDLGDQGSFGVTQHNPGTRCPRLMQLTLACKGLTAGNATLSCRMDGSVALAFDGVVCCCCCCSSAQVDLSDDYVLFMMFADGQWEDDMTPIEFEDDGTGKAAVLTMSEKEFQSFIGILKEPDEEPASKRK